MTILDDIIETKKSSLNLLKIDGQAIHKKRKKLADMIKSDPLMNIIAEVKRGSPSKGLFKADLNVIKTVQTYEMGGASCISVLTDTPYFYGSYDDLRSAAMTTDLPILNKDFIITKEQIDLAKHHGASVILLIKKVLTTDKFLQLFEYALSLELEVLVEIENLKEFQEIEHIPFEMCGINNRNLHDFSIDFKKTLELAPIIKKTGRLVITESGIFKKDDLLNLRSYQVDGALIGESVAKDPHLLKDLICLKKQLEIKICGISDLKTAELIDGLKVEYIGFVFCNSKRQVSEALANDIITELKYSKTVGVFMNQTSSEIMRTKKLLKLDYIQVHGEISTAALEPDKLIRASCDIKESDKYNYFLLDGITPGSGETYSLDNIKHNHPHLFLAGGLNKSNVKNRVLKIYPKVVDISSGVETNGKKDPNKIREFVDEVRRI